MPELRIVLIGTGNVATVLGKKFLAAGHAVVQVFGRNMDATRVLAQQLNAGFTTGSRQVDETADLYVLAVSDSAIAGVARSLKPVRGMVVHTAGSVSKESLKSCSKNYGVLYPLQSLRKEMEELPEIPFLVDGNTEDGRTLIFDFAQTLSKKVKLAGDDERLKLHVAAVVVSNFTNHLYTLAAQYCEKEKTDFNLLLPLITAIAERLYHIPPAASQTGPAVRGDDATINSHLALLKEHPALEKMYTLFTNNIRETGGSRSE